MRKTIEVKQLIDYSNQQLSRTDSYATKEFKQGICVIIEGVLHMTDNYSGFMFINTKDSDIDTLGYYSRKYFTNNKLL
jgi:hypothetical protein